MADPTCTVYLADEGETDRLAACFAPHLGAGDTILLTGSIGAGKTAFCRALIRQAIQQRASDIHLHPFAGGGVVRLRVGRSPRRGHLLAYTRRRRSAIAGARRH